MSLAAGTRLGPYEIGASVGAGGMGEVYRARDTTLNRDVALKVLPGAFAADADRLARFRREAQALAALNHPNIAQIHGFEEAGGMQALVMELVDGPTLEDVINGSGTVSRTASNALAMDDALGIAQQIALALEAAHEAGIVHRDLKPANIKIKADGTVKVLDFGLAKALGTSGGVTAASGRTGTEHRARSTEHEATFATMTSPAMTAMGMILGTAAYMSPEQAKGKPVDRRADIWAFGVVLYEMLTGRPLFAGETVTDVLAAVVTREPDWTRLPADAPAPVQRLLRRCLEKDPKRRLRDAADARLEIDDARSGTTEVTLSAASRAQPSSRRRWVSSAVVAAGLVAGVAIGAVAFGSRGSTEAPLRILSLTLPPAVVQSATISPDGRWVAVVSDRGVIVKHTDAFAWQELAGTAGAGFPLFWSSDSRRIGFPVESALKMVDLVGSRPQTICDRCVQPGSLRGAAWSRDGVILVAGSPEDAKLEGGLWKIAEGGGAMEQVTRLDATRGENSHRFPTFLPDGRRFLFTVRRDNSEHEIRVGDLSGGPSRALVSGFSKTAYGAGHLLFVRDETLLALAIDPATATVSGDPVKVADAVLQSVGTGSAAFGVADDGTLIFVPAPETRGYGIYDRGGQKLADVTTRSADAGGRISPDGRRALIAELDAEKASTDIYVIDVSTGARTRLTSDPNWEQDPVWSPDGRRVAYLARPNRRQGVNIQDATGGSERRIYEADAGGAVYLHDWSPDGRYLLATVSTTTGSELVRLAESDGRMESWAPTTVFESGARFSPDGRWVAYVSDETGSAEVHVRSFAEGGQGRRVTTAGGSAPVWSRDGRELYYRDHEGWVVSVGVRVTGSAIETGEPQRLFRAEDVGLWNAAEYAYDVDARGRFLVYRVGGDADPRAGALTVMQNWTQILNRR